MKLLAIASSHFLYLVSKKIFHFSERVAVWLWECRCSSWKQSRRGAQPLWGTTSAKHVWWADDSLDDDDIDNDDIDNDDIDNDDIDNGDIDNDDIDNDDIDNDDIDNDN